MHPTAQRLVDRLAARGLTEIEVRTLSDSARTAQLAAQALGVEVGQIVKSLVFLRDGEPGMVLGAGDLPEGAPVVGLCAGGRPGDAKRLNLKRADADRVRAVTGFAIGGIPPL